MAALLLAAAPSWARVRVLLYHAHPNMYFTQDLFEEHTDFLRANNYHTITMDQLLAWRESKKPLPYRPIMITFDDNYIDVYRIAYPVLRARGFCGINFTITDACGADYGSITYCTWKQIREMESAKVFYSESHTATHPENLIEMASNNLAEAQAEIAGSKDALERQFGRPCLALAYPYGYYDQTVINLLADAGYRAGFTIVSGSNDWNTPPLELMRVPVDGVGLDDFKTSIGFDMLPPAPPGEGGEGGEGYVLDNADASFFVDSGSWTLASTAPQPFAGDYYERLAGTGAGAVRWAVLAPKSGRYHVHGWWPFTMTAATNALYEIRHAGGTSLISANQRGTGGKWNRLGVFEFAENAAAEVILRGAANGAVLADALWLEQISPAPNGWMAQ